MKRVRRDVTIATKDRQIPWSNSGLIGDFYFNTQQAKQADSIAAFREEQAAWRAIENGTDIASVEGFLKTYSNGLLAKIAQDRLTVLKERSQTVTPIEYAKVRASHILVKNEDEAMRLLTRLQDGADFAKLAKQHSTGPSGAKGGDLGWFEKGVMVPEFESAAFKLKVGQFSRPIKTVFGWHLIELVDAEEVVPVVE